VVEGRATATDSADVNDSGYGLDSDTGTLVRVACHRRRPRHRDDPLGLAASTATAADLQVADSHSTTDYERLRRGRRGSRVR
jgi:hypothetical protein